MLVGGRSGCWSCTRVVVGIMVGHGDGGDDDCGGGGKKKELCLVNVMAKQALFVVIRYK